MKRLYREIRHVILTILCISFSIAELANANPGPRLWSTGKAGTLPMGRWEIGIFQPLRYGLTDKLELGTHPIGDLLIPNLTAKYALSGFHGWQLAVRGTGVYPTPLLRTLTRKGTGGVLAPDPTIPEIPHMVSLRGEILATKYTSQSVIITGKAGLGIGLKLGGKLDDRTTIDLPVIYPRLGVFYNGFALNAGVDFEESISESVGFLIDGDVFLLPGAEYPFFFEQKGLSFLTTTGRVRYMIGYKLTYGKYPYGTQWQILPLADIQWGW